MRTIQLSRHKPHHTIIGLIPFLFGIQQLLEGWQWISIDSGEPSWIIGYFYLFFALLLWPTYLPLSCWMIEQKDTNKKWLGGFLLFGIGLSLYLFIQLIFYPLSIEAVDHHIVYLLGNQPMLFPVALLYIGVTAGAAFISSYTFVRAIGLVGAISALFSWLMYHTAFISVWCFFAALLSVLVYMHVYIPRNPKKR